MDREIAWLFSNEHLSDSELHEAASRIKNGEQPEPPEKLLQIARNTIRQNTLRQTTDLRLKQHDLVRIAAMCLLLTPLAGFAYWWGYRAERPTAAKQVLRITWPIAIGFLVLWSTIIGLRLFG